MGYKLITSGVCIAMSFTLLHGIKNQSPIDERKKVQDDVAEIPLCYWEDKPLNFGDQLSPVLVRRLVGYDIRVTPRKKSIKGERQVLCIGSIIRFAFTGDIIWGSGVSGKSLNPKDYNFEDLDVRAVRGPLTRDFLRKHFDIDVPEIYGDPALLFPYLFPEFKKKKRPKRKFIVIPHYRDIKYFPRELYSYVVFPTEPWQKIIEAILDSEFVISGSLHGIIIAEAYGIPARWLRINDEEHMFKYVDYYLATGRLYFRPAFSIDEALELGGEPPFICNLEKLYRAFPFELWPNGNYRDLDFTQSLEEVV